MKGKKLTRQEMIDTRVVGLPMGEYGIPVTKAQYNAFRELGFKGDELPSWEDAVFSLYPYLRSDEEFAEHYKPLPPLTDEDRARIKAERDKYPTLKSVTFAPPSEEKDQENG